VKKFVAALAASVAVLGMGAATASADNITWGVNDDAGKYENGVGPFWTTLLGVGMTSDTITLRWDETSATGFDGSEANFVGRSLAAAKAAGVEVTLDVYPRHSAALSNPANAAKFATWVSSLAKSYPYVKEFVVMNECNTSLFANPQYARGKNVSAPACGAFLAAAYDGLKAVDSSIFVWGLGLSPRGNPVPKNGRDTRATDPIDWLAFLGSWYRQSGRTAPLMDGLDVHPYPIPQNLPFEAGYHDPTAFSVTNLPRVYQAFYSAFQGTGQKTVGPGRLPVSLNEVGIQTVPTGAVAADYTGTENASGQGVKGTTGGEAYQAAWYRKLVDFSLCDADIAKVNIFKLVDESALEGWQSGLFFQGYVPKASAATFKSEVAKTAGKCPAGSASYFAPGGRSTATPGQQSAKPNKTGKPTKATKPDKTAKPAKGTTPTEPAKPAKGATPTEPAKPAKATEPTGPAKPGEQPTKPGKHK